MLLQSVKLWFFGILDLGPALIWSTYVFISAHNMTALSATGTSSNHLVAQNFNGNFFAVASFLKSSLFAGESLNTYHIDLNRLSICHSVAFAPALKAP